MKTFAIQQKPSPSLAPQRIKPVFSSSRQSLLSPHAKTLADLSRPLLQPKLTIDQPGDQYEQEADRVAAEMLRSNADRSQVLLTTGMQTVGGNNRHTLSKTTDASPTPRVGHDFSKIRVSAPPMQIQPKLTVNQPGDQYEQEADRVAEEVMRSSGLFGGATSSGNPPNVQKKCAACASGGGLCPKCAEEERLQRKPVAATITPLIQCENESASNHSSQVAPQIAANIDSLRGGGQPLPLSVRAFFEPRFGFDFSKIKIHSDAQAAEMSQNLGAQAFTVGGDIFFAPGKFQPETHEGQKLLAHELIHTVQQGNKPSKLVRNDNGTPRIQRRLVTFGTLPDVNALLGLLGPQAGLNLALNVATNQVQINAVLPGAPPSAALRARLTAIINHPTQHAEVIIARGQPQVFVGAFPQPGNLTVTRVQQIDIDDILAIEAGAAGNGVAFAMHEIEENFRAHGVVPLAGTDRFPAAHRQAVNIAENPVAAQLVGPGRRVAFVQVPGTIVPTQTLLGFPIPGTGNISAVANTVAHFFDYENYYLGVTSRSVAATQDQQIVNARRFPKIVVSTRTIDSFASGSNAVPAAGAATIAAAAADVAANPTATVLIQGFSDNVGSAANNLTLSRQRANSVQAALQGAGVGSLRIHAEGLGATNFVAPNVTAADRARNRRVVITVTRPQL